MQEAIVWKLGVERSPEQAVLEVQLLSMLLDVVEKVVVGGGHAQPRFETALAQVVVVVGRLAVLSIETNEICFLIRSLLASI